MKKIYTLILLAAAALGANAQVVLTYQGNVVTPGTTLDIEAYEKTVDPYEYYVDMGYEDFYTGPITSVANNGTSDPVLVNKGEEAVKVTATVTTTTPEHFQWCFPDQCKDLKNEVTTNEATIAASGMQLLALDAHFKYGTYVETPYEATVKVEANGKTDTYTLRYSYTADCAKLSFILDAEGHEIAAGISAPALDATNTTSYDLAGRRAGNAASIVISADGRKSLRK